MQKTLKNNLRLGLGLSLIVLFTSSLASWISIHNLIKSSDLVARSNEIIANLDNVIIAVKDAETGQRGFLLSGDEVFLEPYNGAKERATAVLNEIAVQTLGNRIYQRNIKLLRENVMARMEILDENLSIKRRGGHITVSQLLSGKKFMDESRALIRTMKIEERRLLAQQTADLNRLAGYTPNLILLAAFLAVMITFFFYRKVSADFNLRMKLQQQLQDKNQEMDARIEVIREPGKPDLFRQLPDQAGPGR